MERHRVVERWRSERWDGLYANGPAWSDSMPGYPIPWVDADEFASRDQIVDYFIAYAETIKVPVRCGVDVTALYQRESGAGFRAETSQGPIEAVNVVAATGHGAPVHRRGVTAVPGLYFLGLPWLSKRTSSVICGVGHDAARLADHIAARGLRGLVVP